MNTSEPMNDTLSGVPLSPVSRRRKGTLHLYPHAIIGALVIITAWFHSSASHKHDLETKQHHADFVASLLRTDARFQRIQVLASTSEDSPLRVSGDVTTREDAEILRIIVASTKPPLRTQFIISVRVNGSNQTEAVYLPDLPAYRS